MFSNVGLDVFIGLVFVFLLYSLLATVLQEIVAHFLDLRARMLVKSIRVMLDDRETNGTTRIARLLYSLWQNMDHFNCPLKPNKFSRVFYQHPSIKYLAQSSWRSKPAYISSFGFSSTLVKILRGDDFDGTEPQMNAIYRTLFQTKRVASGAGTNAASAPIEPETLAQIRQLYLDAQKDIDRFKTLLEKWYDELQDRTTGWYKKQSQIILFFIGLAIAFIFNADAIAITTILSKDKKAREDLVNLAVNSQDKYDSLTRKLTKIHLKDSVQVITGTGKSLVAGKPADTSTRDKAMNHDTVWRYREYDTLLLSDRQLTDAYNMVMADINEANNILGLGRKWKDSCVECAAVKQNLAKSNVSDSLKQALLQFLETEKGKEWCGTKCITRGRWLQYHPLQAGGLFTILGWILTAFAVSLGAPFWFDMLNKIIRLRATGPKPKDDPPGGLPASAGNVPGSSSIQRVG